MDRPARNKKSVDYSQFLDLADEDEDFASSPPVSKKARLETKREKKEKPIKKIHKVEATTTDSEKKRLPLEDKLYQRDLEVALALSVKETSVIIEKDENTPRNEAPVNAYRYIDDPDVSEVSFSNCSVDSNHLGLDEITDDNEDTVRGRGRRQAASKAITEQRKLLAEESDDEEEADEFHPDAVADEDSESDASFSGEDEEFEVKKSKKPSTNKVVKQKPNSGTKEKNVPKADEDSESDASFSGEDEEFEVKKSKKPSTNKVVKQKPNSEKKNVPKAPKAATASPTPVTLKIKPMPAKKATVSSPTASKPVLHSSPPVGVKRPAWTPPASSGATRSPLDGVTVKSPNQGLRLGLSRLARVKPLHSTTAPH